MISIQDFFFEEPSVKEKITLQIILQPQGSTPIVIEIDQTASISELKEKINKKRKINFLKYKNIYLEDSKAISHYKFPDNAIIKEEYIGPVLEGINPIDIKIEQIYTGKIEENTITVTVKSLIGKIFEVNINNDAIIRDMCLKIQRIEGTPCDDQRLLYEGKQLEHDIKINKYNIINGSLIYLVLRLRGGMFHPTSGRAGDYKPLEDCIIIVQPDLDFDSDQDL
jgi:hypothetical protein